jgi:hypothetical protein
MNPLLVGKRAKSGQIRGDSGVEKSDANSQFHAIFSRHYLLYHHHHLTEKMRAILIKDGKGPVDNLYIGETATPVVKSQEVQVKVRTASHTRLSRHNAQITSDHGLCIKSHGCFATPGSLPYSSGRVRDSRRGIRWTYHSAGPRHVGHMDDW